MISPLLSRTLIDTRKILERKESLLRIFWSCKTKEIDRKSWNLSLICNNPRYQNFTETQKSSTTKFFGTPSQKTFHKKLWCPPLMHKILPYRRLLKHRRIRLRSFSVIWDNEFPTATRDTPSFQPPLAPPPSPIVLINLSGTRNFLELRTPLRKFSVLWDNKSSTGNRYTPSFPPSPLVVINFSDSEHSQQHKRKPSRYFSVLWDKKIPTEKSGYPLGYLEHFLIPEFFWNTEKVSYEFFGLVRQKCFDGKSWRLSTICNNSRYQKITETQKSSTTKFFGTLSQKTFDRKLWRSPFMQKIFPYRRVSKHQKIRLWSFSVMWDNELPTGTRDTPSFAPPPSSSGNFRIAKTPRNTNEIIH